MTVGELLQTIREDYLDDDVAPYLWKQATLLRLLSRAQEEACMRQRLLVDETTPAICEAPLVAGQKDYALDPRIVLVESIRYDGRVLNKWTKPQLDRTLPGWADSVGPITDYLQNDLTISLLQAPTVADDGNPLALRVWRLPLNGFSAVTDVPEIPLQYHRDLIWLVIGEAFALPDEDRQDTRRADYYLDRFDKVFGPTLRADVLANWRREGNVSFVGNAHGYHGRPAHRLSAAQRFDFED